MKIGDILWGLGLVAAAAVLAVPATQEVFVRFTTLHPYPAGFVKFAVLATMGELLALRILASQWVLPRALAARAAIWGVLGMAIALFFPVYVGGVQAAMAQGLLPGGDDRFLRAFFTATLMNLTFGPALMGFHRFTDTWLDLRSDGGRPTVAEVARRIDWAGFCSFVLARTIPLFWIPAHTLVFLLPAEYRVVAAAFLSVALGGILAFAKKRAVSAP